MPITQFIGLGQSHKSLIESCRFATMELYQIG